MIGALDIVSRWTLTTETLSQFLQQVTSPFKESSMVAALLLVFGVAAGSLLFWSSRSHRRRLPPSPGRPLPFFGHLQMLGVSDPREIFASMRKRYGEIFSFYTGSRLIVVLNGYETIHEALVKKSDVFSARPETFISIHMAQGHGIVNTSGEHWQEQRRFAERTLRGIGINDTSTMEAKVLEEVAVLMDKLDQTCCHAADDPLNLPELFMASISNVIVSIIYGHRFDLDDPTYCRALKALNNCFKNFSNMQPLNFFPIVRYLPGDPCGYHECVDNMHTLESTLVYPELDKHQHVLHDAQPDDVVSAYLLEMERKRGAGTPTTMDIETPPEEGGGNNLPVPSPDKEGELGVGLANSPIKQSLLQKRQLQYYHNKSLDRKTLSEGPVTRVGESLREVSSPTHFLTTKVKTRTGAWNIRTMYERGKSSQVAHEMKSYGIKLLGLCETRWNGIGQTRLTSGETIIYSSISCPRFLGGDDDKQPVPITNACTMNDEENLVKVAGDLLAGGSKTPSTTVLWFVLYMLHYPDIQERCYQEIVENIGKDQPPSMAKRLALPYTEATILEVLRHADVGPLGMPHGLSRDTELRGYDIPSDAMVIANLHSVHHDPEVWGDPEVFRPERFLDVEGRVVKSKYLIPFSIGSRKCPGEGLTRMELFLYATSILQRYHLSCHDSSLPPLQGSLTLLHTPPSFNVRFQRRQ